MIYVVLGMHKSGTTLVSEILHKSGINMGNFDEAIGYDQGNQYERKETLELNMEILGCTYNDISYDVIRPVTAEKLSAGLRSKMTQLVEELNKQHDNWGFKDPRTCLTYSVWRDLLPEHRLIVVYRHPLEVWHHYLRNIPSIRLILKLHRSWKTLRAWYVYNSELLKHLLNSTSKYIVFDFSNFMTSEELFRELEMFVGKQLKDRRKDCLYRAKRKPNFLYELTKFINSIMFSRDVESLYWRLKTSKNHEKGVG